MAGHPEGRAADHHGDLDEPRKTVVPSGARTGQITRQKAPAVSASKTASNRSPRPSAPDHLLGRPAPSAAPAIPVPEVLKAGRRRGIRSRDIAGCATCRWTQNSRMLAAAPRWLRSRSHTRPIGSPMGRANADVPPPGPVPWELVTGRPRGAAVGTGGRAKLPPRLRVEG